MRLSPARTLAAGLFVVAGASVAGAAAATEAPFRLDPLSDALRGRPELRERLLASAHGYFRFLGAPFAQEVCRRFQGRPGVPEANLHGDAHVEQYAVTSLGRGLTDFDDANRGPFVLDLVRFGVSLQLAAQQRGWPDEGARSLSAFLRGYRARLGTSKSRPLIPTPRVVTRIRATFRLDHGDLLRRTDATIDAAPVPVEKMIDPFREYVARTLEAWSGIPEPFFKLKRMGELHMGIGSALDTKYLLRIEGWTEAEDDDLVLEAKLVRDQRAVECLRHETGPNRVMHANALIPYQPFPFSGLLTGRDGQTFWVHAWPDDYQELAVATSFESPRDLREVAFDVGVQLGRAHPATMNGPTGQASRRALQDAAGRYDKSIREAVAALTREVEAAWQEFRVPASVPTP